MVVVGTQVEVEAWARGITRRIQEAGEAFGALLLEAHEGNAWEALGYKSWGDYVAGEFTFSRSQSYRLLIQERVNRALPPGEKPASGREAEKVVAHARHSLQDSQAVVTTLKDIRDKKPKRRGPPDKASVLNAISLAIDNLEGKMEGYEDEEIAASLSVEERRIYERAVEKATQFADRGARILMMDVRAASWD